MAGCMSNTLTLPSAPRLRVPRFTGVMRQLWSARMCVAGVISPRHPTPAPYAVVGNRDKLSMISTVTNKGEASWMTVDDAFNSDTFIEFVKAPIKDADKKV